MKFQGEEIDEWTKPESSWHPQWVELVKFLAKNLDQSKVTLSIDAGPAYNDYVEHGLIEEDLHHVKEAYKMIIESLRDEGPWVVECFKVFFAVFHDLEAEAEIAVYGKATTTDKKVPHTERNPDFLHGAPPGYEYVGGMKR